MINNYHFFDNFGELKALNDNYTESDLVISKDNPSYELSKGYYSNDFTVGITSNDEENLLAENIRAGVTLLGVEGTYTGQININNEVLLPASTRLTLTYLSNGEVLSGLTMDGGQPLTLRLVKTLGSCPYRNWVIMFNGDKSSAVLVGSIPPSAKTLEYTIPVVPVSINVEAIPEGTTLYFNITNQRQPRLIDGVFEANGMYYPENEENPADGYKSVSVAIPFSSTSVTASDVAPGVTFYNQDGQIDTGTMPTESTDIIFSPGHTTETLDGRYFCDALVYATPYLVDGEEGIVHPTTSQQTINASEAFFTKFTVGPAQDVYLNAMATISSPSDVLAGTYYLAETGIEEGTMPDNGIVSATISTKAGTVNIPAGYTSGGTVSISSTEQAKIIASNIKKDVTILGVTGTLEGSSAVLIQKNINQPGTYNASSDNADGYYSVTVTGPQITQDPITGIVTII